tara:strand:+ start:323 stop:577 length:255 start_codon:yes stop_codon:yes gene_type:complete
MDTVTTFPNGTTTTPGDGNANNDVGAIVNEWPFEIKLIALLGVLILILVCIVLTIFRVEKTPKMSKNIQKVSPVHKKEKTKELV